MTITKNSETSDVTKEKPLDVAERRYAAGEITNKELAEIKKNLSNK